MSDHSTPTAPKTRGHTIRRWARFYDWLTRLMSLGRRDTFRTSVLAQADLAAGMRVLDVGCGTGTLALDLKRAVGDAGTVSGVDASPEMIEIATKKARGKGVAIDLRVGVAEELPYENSSFDRVTSTLVFHHLPDDLKLESLREIHRVLQPGGRVVVGDFAPGSGPFIHRVLSRVLGRLEQLHGGRDDDSPGHSHGQTRPLVELMRETEFSEATLSPSADAQIEFTVATRPV
jgi:ubiquinone/menaquinone biosynthesis C-methylase UbiE